MRLEAVHGRCRTRCEAMTGAGLRTFLALVALTVIPAVGTAQVMPGAGGTAMPDAKRMSGVPLPVGNLSVGTVTVRVARGAVTNLLPGQPVTLVVAGTPRSMSTNESGR